MDNKINMDFNNTVKIIISALLFIAAILGLALKKPENEEYKTIDNDKLYSMAKKYLIDEEINNNSNLKVIVEDVQVFSDFALLGVNQKEEETEVYIWALVESYYVENGSIKKRGYSSPSKFIFKDDKIISVYKPGFSDSYPESIKQYFPQYIIDKFKDEIPVTTKNVDIAVSKYYSYLPNYYHIVKTDDPTKNYLIYAEGSTLNDIFSKLYYNSITAPDPLPDPSNSDYLIYSYGELEYTLTIKENNDYYLIDQTKYNQDGDSYEYISTYLTWSKHNELEKILNKYFGN